MWVKSDVWVLITSVKVFSSFFNWGAQSSSSVLVNQRCYSVPWKFETSPYPIQNVSSIKTTSCLNYEKFCFCLPFTLPSECPNSDVFFQHLQQASAIDLRSSRRIKFLWHLFPASGEIICTAESPVKVEKRSVEISVFISLPYHFFSFGCCPWCRWRLIGSASPWATYRSTAPQWSWSYSCFALKLQLKVSIFFQPTYNI